MRSLFRWIALLSAFVVALATSARGATGTVLIKNATVMTASDEGTLENTDILIRNGIITEIGQGLQSPSDATIIDASGRYVIPGIVDCHSHMAAESINESTTQVSAAVRIKDVLQPEDINLAYALTGGVTTIHILHGSANVIGGQDAVIKLKWGKPVEEMIFKEAPQGIKFALGENPRGSNWERGNQRWPNTRMGVESVLREAFSEARNYMREWDDYKAKKRKVPPRKDLKLETLAGILRGEILVHSHCYRADEILMLIRVAEDFGFKIATFQHVLEGYKVADEIARHGAGASTFADNWAYKLEAYDAIPYNMALMWERGVVVSINSDSGERVRRLFQDAAKAVKYGGVPEQEALKMITLNAAKQLGIDPWVGSIEKGKQADLAIFNMHPFSSYTRCEMTMIEGEVYFDRQQYERERAEKARPTEEKKPTATKTRQQAAIPRSH